jgi:hypothetical protein
MILEIKKIPAAMTTMIDELTEINRKIYHGNDNFLDRWRETQELIISLHNADLNNAENDFIRVQASYLKLQAHCELLYNRPFLLSCEEDCKMVQDNIRVANEALETFQRITRSDGCVGKLAGDAMNESGMQRCRLSLMLANADCLLYRSHYEGRWLSVRGP